MELLIKYHSRGFVIEKMEDEVKLDVAYWLSRTPQERISAVTNLRRTYFTWLNGCFPTKKKLSLKGKWMFRLDNY